MKTLFLALISGMFLTGCTASQKLPESVVEYQASLTIESCIVNDDVLEFIHTEHLLVRDDNDYILIHNYQNPLEPLRLQQGDYFVDLKLEKILISRVEHIDNRIANTGIAEFSGNIIIAGDFKIWGGLCTHIFVPHEEYLSLFPQFEGNDLFRDSEPLGEFTIINEDNFFNMLGVHKPTECPHYSDQQEQIVFTNIIIELDFFTLLFLRNGGKSSANIVNVLK